MSTNLLSPIGIIPNGWKLEKLANITTKIGSGSTPRGGESAYLDKRVEYAFVRSQNVFDFHFSKNQIKFISKTNADKLKGVHLQKEDVLLNITGDGVTFARACIVPVDILPAAVNQHVSIIRVNKAKCLPGYLLAYLCLPQIKEYIANFNAGGSRRAITKGHIESFEVPIAPMHVQRHIQKVTFNFIDKIELNTQTNHTLEAMAQALFKSWFVDFEPVRAKQAVLEAGGSQEEAELAAMAAISGKTPAEIVTLKAHTQAQSTEAQEDTNVTTGKMPGEIYAELAATAALFPDQLVELELGLIPDGWENGTVNDIVQRLKPKERYTKNQVKPFGKIPVFEQGTKILLGFHDGEAGFDATPESPIFIFGDHTCITHLSCSKFDISSNVIPLKGSIRPTIWAYYAIQGLQEFQEYRRHWSEFLIKEITIPPIELCLQFQHIITKQFLMIESLKRQSKQLEQLRDTLLPKLLSGELPLDNMERDEA
jgi:type I restriction enzyme S subunit